MKYSVQLHLLVMCNKLKVGLEKFCEIFLDKDSRAFPYFSVVFLIILALITLGHFYFKYIENKYLGQTDIYLASLSMLLLIVALRWRLNAHLVYRARKIDPSKVRSIISDVETIEPTVSSDQVEYRRPVNYEEKEKQLINQKMILQAQLNDKPHPVTEKKTYQPQEFDILTVQIGLVDFTKAYDLERDALSLLNSLEEYSQDSSYAIDRESFEEQRCEVTQAINVVKDAIAVCKSPKELLSVKDEIYIEEQAERLRATVRSLYEYEAEYLENWARGSVALSGLKLCCSFGIPVFLVWGLIPISLPLDPGLYTLRWFDWAFISTSGALTAVLLTFLKSDEVEIGNTQSRLEISRAMSAAVLGFVSGAVIYSMIGGELIGKFTAQWFIPDVTESYLKNALLSVVWAFASGFLFEKFLNKAKATINKITK